ncbi:MAG: DUF5906 domain-containing protein [Candidatus Kapabacteria bacterium]|jgi:hypothetical protein|nr:DUF5906 domain-containing protein [Candidatus Kapabacteria bacterium]
MSNRIKPSIFDVPVSQFRSASDKTPKQVHLSSILREIKSNKYRVVIQYLRGLEEAQYDEEKKLLPAFTVAGTFYEERKAKNIEHHSGFAVIDFDDIPHLADAKFALKQDRHTAACFLSPSGKGLKVVVRVVGITSPEEHKALYEPLATYYRTKHGLNLSLDESGKDVSRLCFVSWDADLYVNEQAEIFSVEGGSLPTHEQKRNTAPISDSTTKTAINTRHTRKIALKALEKAKEAIRSAPKGTRHETRLKHIETVGGYIQINGLTESEVRAELLPIVRDSSDSPERAEKEFEEFLMYGIEHPIDIENEVRKQREYAARKETYSNGTEHKKSPAPNRSEAEIFSMPHENTKQSVTEQGETTKKKKSRANSTRQQTKIDFVESWLSERYEFRNNAISSASEFRAKGAKEWKTIDDHYLSSIWRAMEKNDVKFSESRLQRLIVSDFADYFNPFTDYFTTLPAWDGTERICEYAGFVHVLEEQTEVWQKYFRRWLLALVATALQRGLNTSCLVIVGAQNLGKNTYFRNLMPSALQTYYHSTAADFSNTNNKDAEFMLTSNLVLMLDEMESVNKKEVGTLKSLITRPEINARRPYDRLPKILPRYASFCGSVNHSSFLSDLTGSRRFLCVEATRIEWHSPTDEYLHQLYAEALHALDTGETFSFSLDEIAEINTMNEQFQVASSEVEEILETFAPIAKKDAKAENFYTTNQIMKKLQERNPNFKTGTKTLGIALEKCGFEKGTKRINSSPVKCYFAQIVQSV